MPKPDHERHVYGPMREHGDFKDGRYPDLHQVRCDSIPRRPLRLRTTAMLSDQEQAEEEGVKPDGYCLKGPDGKLVVRSFDEENHSPWPPTQLLSWEEMKRLGYSVVPVRLVEVEK